MLRRCVWCGSHDLPRHHLLLSTDVSPVAAVTLVSRTDAAAWLRKAKKKRRQRRHGCLDVMEPKWATAGSSARGRRQGRDDGGTLIIRRRAVQSEGKCRFLGKWTILSCSSVLQQCLDLAWINLEILTSTFSKRKIICDKGCRYSSWRCLPGFLDTDGKPTNALCCRCRRRQTCVL